MEDGSLLVVPEKQITDFMFLMDFSKEAMVSCNEHFAAGDTILHNLPRFVMNELLSVNYPMRLFTRFYT